VLALILLPSLADGSRARADDGDRQPLNSVLIVFGAGTPVGGFGLEYVRRFRPWAELTGGLGAGSSALEKAAKDLGVGSPLQWAVMPRLRLGNSRHSFTLGVGLSGGNYAHVHRVYVDYEGGERPPPTVGRIGYVVWANFEIGGEHWFGREGLYLRYFLGLANSLNPGTLTCPNSVACGTPYSYYVLPYYGFGLGYAF
jgi:hypothetical protein